MCASSTIITALNNGAHKIIPVSTVSTARKLKLTTPSSLLCGERKGVKPTGFNLGNSPREYTRRIVQGKTIILTTSNFTRVLQHLLLPEQSMEKHGIDLITASFLNISATVKKIQQLRNVTKKQLTILLAGNKKRRSPEDHSAADLLKTTLKGLKPPDTQQNYLNVLKESPHGKFLMSIGLGKDLEVCSQLNTTQLVPIFKNGAFQI